MQKFYLLLFTVLFVAACNKPASQIGVTNTDTQIKPVIVSDTVRYDTDDPAIWFNYANPEKSIIIGTDKDEDGALYAFDLSGHELTTLTVRGLKRPNNVDIAYELASSDTTFDIAVVTERMTHRLRIFSLPDLKPMDNGGIEVFERETPAGFRDLMGISLYKNPKTQNIYAIVGRKSGPTEGYLWQYKLTSTAKGIVKAELVRKFGKYSGKKEIESIAVDNELGYVYYSDEGVGIRKYYADPEKGNEELALFGTSDFTQDHEGISIYKMDNGTGYILVSDQQANRFNVFPREGSVNNPNEHVIIKSIDMSTVESDGSEIINLPINEQFRQGLFVAMSTDKTFQFYKWEDMAGKDLKVAPQQIIHAPSLSKP